MFQGRRGLIACVLVSAGGLPAAAAEPARPVTLTVGVVQTALEPDLAGNRDKIVRFIGQAKAKGCHVVVFPETALYMPVTTPRADRDAAIESVRQAAAEHGIYVIFCTRYTRDDREKPFERLHVFDPQGKTLQRYDKLWADARFPNVPGPFAIDGIPCCAAICADRWIRGVEELPVMAGAQILFECSNNFDNEWIADQGWYWYVPRAMRNQAYVVFANSARASRGDNQPGHGHSAVIDPDGGLVVAADGESDRLLVATLDLSKATRARALERRDHPLFRPFWDAGVRIMNGEAVPAPAVATRRSPKVRLTIAAAQMPCSRNVGENVACMKRLIRTAKAKGVDVVAFPELAVTGALDADILGADEAALRAALSDIQAAARADSICVAFGMPYSEAGRRYNGAFVVGADGSLLTRHAQLVVDRPSLFAPGLSTKTLWFEVRGVPGVVTIGRDALWSEIAELAAVRGAQVHLHLAHDRDTSDAATLRRRQLWVNLASFRTFTATVNAAAPAAGGSALWEDFHRGRSGAAGGYVPHCAVRLAEAGAGEEVLCATQDIPETNGHLDRMTRTTNPQMKPWYLTGAQAVAADGPAAPQVYFPPPEARGGWRSLVRPNEGPTPKQKDRVRREAGLDWDKLRDAWDYSTSFGGPGSVVVIRRGWVAGEWFTDRTNRGIASCTKSLTALAVAKLCELSAAGRTKKSISFDEPAWKYLPPAWGEQDPRRKAIAIHHLLTMSSGLDPYDGPYQDLNAYADLILARRVEAEPGKVWAYSSSSVDLLSLIVEDVSGQLMGDFFNEHISRPIGAGPVEFPKFRGHSGGSGGPGGGARLPARDLARLGYLLLHGGRWRDDAGEKQVFTLPTAQLLSRWAPQLAAATFREHDPALASRLEKNSQETYGYLIWTNRIQQRLGKAVPADTFYFSGWGKQACWVIPSLDMVVVRLGPHRTLNDHPEYYAEFLARVLAGVVRER